MNLFKQRQPPTTLHAAMERQYQDGVSVGRNWAILFGGMFSAALGLYASQSLLSGIGAVAVIRAGRQAGIVRDLSSAGRLPTNHPVSLGVVSPWRTSLPTGRSVSGMARSMSPGLRAPITAPTAPWASCGQRVCVPVHRSRRSNGRATVSMTGNSFASSTDTRPWPSVQRGLRT